MENGAISDGQVKASTEWDKNHAAIQGRLNYLAKPGKAGSWSAKFNNLDQWLQIDLDSRYTKCICQKFRLFQPHFSYS